MVNKQTLLGNVGQDGEFKQVTEKFSTLKFAVATSHGVPNRETGKWDNITTWHNVEVTNPSQYLQDAVKKGALVYLEGRTDHNKYEDKDGNTRVWISVKAFSGDVKILSRRSENDASIANPGTPAPDDDIPF